MPRLLALMPRSLLGEVCVMARDWCSAPTERCTGALLSPHLRFVPLLRCAPERGRSQIGSLGSCAPVVLRGAFCEVRPFPILLVIPTLLAAGVVGIQPRTALHPAHLLLRTFSIVYK